MQCTVQSEKHCFFSYNKVCPTSTSFSSQPQNGKQNEQKIKALNPKKIRRLASRSTTKNRLRLCIKGTKPPTNYLSPKQAKLRSPSSSSSSSQQRIKPHLTPPMSDHHHLAGDHHPSPASTALGPLLLLPSELLHEILLRLAVPELLRVRSVSRPLSHLISSPDFRRLYHLTSASSCSGPAAAWLLLFKKLPPRDAAIRGFHGPSGRWFRIPVSAILAPAVPPREDLYFLAASGSSFLFAANDRRELVVVDLTARAARRLPPSPLGPRGTSSWRRFGLKLVADPPGSNRFRFLFAELVNNTPFLFEYRSETDTWQQSEAVLATEEGNGTPDGGTYLCAAHAGPDCVMVYSALGADPVFFRPRFPPQNAAAPGDRLHVYGDGSAAVVRSAVVVDEPPSRTRVKVVTGVDLYGLAVGGDWELAASVPGELVEGFRRPYAVMTGLLAEREGVVRLVLVSNCRGAWDFVWLSYDRARREWQWVPVPDWGASKGLNMAGIAVSSTFSRLWPLASSSTSSHQ